MMYELVLVCMKFGLPLPTGPLTGQRYGMPTRSMVGQLPLEQHIGVRIPGGQPI